MTTETLTDRYVAAVLRSIPEPKRADIDAELRATIADSIDARVAAGGGESDAEADVLRELGDPALLAAGYADRPLHLIGPALFLDYWRLLRLLLVIVLPCTLLGLLIAKAIEGVTFGEAVGSAVATTIQVGVHLCFWITLVFVIVERTGRGAAIRTAFDPEMLPASPTAGRITRGETIGSVLFPLFVAGAVVWQQYFSVFADASGQPIPLLQPALWSFWIPCLLVVLAASIVLAIVLHRAGRWTIALAAVNAVISLAIATGVVVLQLGGALLEPTYFARFGWEDAVAPDGIITPSVVLVVLGVAAWTSIDGFRRAVRAARNG